MNPDRHRHRRSDRARGAGGRSAFVVLALATAIGGVVVAAAPASGNNFRPCGRFSSAAAATTTRQARRPTNAPAAPRAQNGWPRFRFDAAGAGLNPNEVVLDDTTVPTLVRTWHTSTGGPIESSPVVAGGLVYVGSDDNDVYAFVESTGKVQWSYRTGGIVRSSPAVAGGVVYVGSDDGTVYALNASTGKLVWKHPTGAVVHSSPNVVNGVAYVGSEDGNLYALRTSNGSTLWAYPTGGPITSSPAVFTQQHGTVAVYVGSADTKVYAVEATKGTLLWSFATKGVVESSPAVAAWNGGDILVIGSDDLNYYGIDADSGKKRWVCATNGIEVSSPAISVAMGRAYWGTHGWDVQGHNLSDGMTDWSYTCGSAVPTSPAVADGVVYAGCGKDQNIYAFRETFSGLGADPQKLTRKIWQFDTGGAVMSSPSVSDGMVFIGSDTGELNAFGLP